MALAVARAVARSERAVEVAKVAAKAVARVAVWREETAVAMVED